MTYPPTYSYEQPAAPPPKRSNGPLVAIVVALAVLLVGGAGVVGVLLLRDGGENPGGGTTPTAQAGDQDPPKSSDNGGGGKKVVYEVSGDGPVSIVYLKEDGRSLAPAKDEELPWRLELTMEEDAVAVTVTAIRSRGGDGTVSCRITLDGEEVAKRSANGTFATASCNKLLL